MTTATTPTPISTMIPEKPQLLEMLDSNLGASQKGNPAQDVLRIRRTAQIVYMVIFQYKLNYDLFVCR